MLSNVYSLNVSTCVRALVEGRAGGERGARELCSLAEGSALRNPAVGSFDMHVSLRITDKSS